MNRNRLLLLCGLVLVSLALWFLLSKESGARRNAPRAPAAAARLESRAPEPSPAGVAGGEGAERVEPHEREVVGEGSPPAPAQQELFVLGRLEDGDGRPVAGALVRAGFTLADQSVPVGASESDAEGAYRIAASALGGLTAYQRSRGWLRVTADAEGYLPARRRVALPQTFAADLRVDLRLEPGPTVSGRVLAPNGAPVDGASVAIVCDRPQGRTEWLSDENGRFRAPLVATLLRIEASAPGIGVLERAFAPEPPRSLDLGDLVLEVRSTAEGWLVCSDGGGLPHVALALKAVGGGGGEAPPARTETEPDGFFRFVGLDPGEYTLYLDGSRFEVGKIVTDRPGERYTLDVRTVRVLLRDAGGSPLPGVQVRAYPVGERIDSERYRALPHRRMGTTAGADAACVLRLNPEKEFVLSTEVVGGAFAEMFLPARTGCENQITLTLGSAPRAALALAVRDSAGQRTDAYEVELLSSGTGELRYYLDAEEVDRDLAAGDATLLEPGDYRLRVVPLGETARFSLPADLPLALSEGERRSLDVSLEAGGRLRVRVDLGPDAEGGRVHGKLLDRSGEVVWRLEDPQGSGSAGRVVVGRWAEAELLAPAGAYDLVISADWYRERKVPVGLRAGETHAIELALEPGGG